MNKLDMLLPFREYRTLERGEQLCIFGDPADARDFCAAVAVSKKHADFPLVFNELTESSQFGYEIEKMAKYIQHRTGFWPMVAVERNTGQATIHVLTILNYPNLYRMRVFDSISYKESEKIGWLTTESSRRKMLDDLSLASRQGVAKIYDKEVLDQMFSFVVKKGKPQAESGKKDDLVMACYSDDTEVLTVSGWKLISDVGEGEKIPSLNMRTGVVETTFNKETISLPYKGKMIHFGGRSVDIVVTPNHRMVVKKSHGQNKYSDLMIARADTLVKKHFRLINWATWTGKEKKEWIISGYKPSKFHTERPPIVFEINDFLSLLGFYIAEGSGKGNSGEGWQLNFAQMKKSKGFIPFKNLLERMKIRYKYDGRAFLIYNSQLTKYIKLLVPGYAHEKRIPRQILNLHPNHLKHLFEYLMLGDGYKERIYVTTSEKLKDDFIELTAKIGKYSTWKSREPQQGGCYKGRIINGTHKIYFISVGGKQKEPRFNHHDKDMVKQIAYDGRVVCLSLDKNHTMFVRRNGKTCWSGNTAGAWQLYLTVPLQYADEGDQDWKLEKEKWRLK